MAANNQFENGDKIIPQITINIQSLTINNGTMGNSQIQNQSANVFQPKAENKGKSKLLKVLAGIVGFFKKVATKIGSLIRFLLRLK